MLNFQILRLLGKMVCFSESGVESLHANPHQNISPMPKKKGFEKVIKIFILTF